MSQVATPTFNPDGGTYPSNEPVTVTITTTTAAANIRYTLDGTTPTATNGTLIAASSGTVAVTSTAQGTVLKAVAFKSSWVTSGVKSATYSMPQVAMPQFNPLGGPTSFPVSVTITAATAGDGMRYTLDGTIPTATNGTLIAGSSGSVSITGPSVLKAVAFKIGWIPSAVKSASYVIKPGEPDPLPTPPMD